MYKSFVFDRARNCLRFLVKSFDIKEMFIPYYLCDVVRHTLFEEGCKPLFYHIDDNFFPSQEFPKDSYILYPNYFGVFGQNVEKLVKIYPKLIVDNAHAFFDSPSGFACFNSGIKFNQEEKAYLWVKDFSEKSDNVDIPQPDSLQKKRLNQFMKLHQTYSSINKLNIVAKNSIYPYPFCYPLLAETEEIADSIVKDLTQKGLTIYRYWNALPKSYNEYKFYSRLVPIPLLSSFLEKRSKKLFIHYRSA